MQTYQILTIDHEVCIPSLASILIAVSMTMTLFSKKMLNSNRFICGFMPNLHKKSLEGLFYVWFQIKLQTHLESMWNHSEPSEFPCSSNK